MSDTLKYFNLAIPAPRRLQMMRDAFAKHATKYPHCPESAKPKSWRDIRGTTHASVSAYVGNLWQGSNGSNQHDRVPVWYTQSGAKFRDERNCDEVSKSIQHNGWYCDVDCVETARGIVGRLTHGRFIAGYTLSCNEERVYFGQVYADEHEAAQMADEHARVIAESEQEHSAQFRAAQDIEDDLESALARLLECLALRNNACFKRMRDEARELIETIREKRDELKTDFAGVL